MLKKAVSILLVLFIALSFVGCGNNSSNNGSNEATDSDSFKLGAFLQLTGGNSAYGLEAKNAIELAVEYINEQGGFNGQKIQFIPYDTQGSPEEAVKIATKLIENDKVNAVIGSVNSGEVLAAAGYLNDAGIVTFGLGTSPTWMEKDWPFVFRASMNNKTAAPLTADMLVKLGLKSVGIFKGQDDASLSTAEAFKKACEERGIKVTADESYDAGDTDFSAQIANILNTNPQTVYISVIGETGPIIVKQLRQYGYNGIIFDKESFMISQIEIAGKEASNYIAFANPYVTYSKVEDCDIPLVRDFIERYEAKYGNLPATDSSYRGWDTMMVLWEASKIAGSNEPDAIRQAVHQVKIDGLGGTLDYTKGDREGYSIFNTFILVDGKNVLFDKWIENGGYDAYKQATGRAY